MKVEVLQENLSKALSVATRFSSSRMQLPIIANVLLKAEKNKLTVSATNLEMSISFNLGAKVEEDGEITVPARSLYEVVSNLKPGTLSLVAEKEKLNIESVGFKSVLLGMNASEFPKLPGGGKSASITLANTDLSEILSKVLFAVSTDETRPTLTGVLFIVEKQYLSVISTDGFRLSRKRVKIESEKEEFKIIIPKNVLIEVSRMSSDNQKIDLSFDKAENQIVFSYPNITVSSRIIDGSFPDFEKILPKRTEIEIEVDSEEFQRAIKLASVFARDSSNAIKLALESDSMSVSAESSQSGLQESKIDAKIKAPELSEGLKFPFVISFNCKFIEDFLNVSEGESVKLGFTDPNSPTVFEDPKDPEFLHIIMPIRLQS